MNRYSIIWFSILEKFQFLRSSREAHCPIPKVVDNPIDTNFTIQEVFFNVCGFVEGYFWDQMAVSYYLSVFFELIDER